MIKIWAKVIKNNKTKKDYVLFDPDKIFELNDLREYLNAICEQLDLENPILLDQHLVQLVEYRVMKFLPTDFIDVFPYDKLEIHNLSE